MLKPPPLSPFCFGTLFSPFSAVAMTDGGDPPPQSLTNAQKLSLPSNTAVGTQVSVSDGFVVRGAQAAIEAQTNGFYAPNGTTQNGHPVYQNDNGRIFYFVEGRGWVIDIASNLGYINVASQTTSAGSGPWESNWTNQSGLTFTHPAIQQLAAPSSVQGGVFVSGGDFDGIYPINSGLGIINGPVFQILGASDPMDAGVSTIKNDAGWNIRDGISTPLYYSLSDVATPDLVVATPPVFVIDFNNLTVTGGNYYGTSDQSFYNGLLEFSTFDLLQDTTITWSPPPVSDGVAIYIGVVDSPTKQQIIDKLVAIGGGKIVDLGGLIIRVSPTDRALLPLGFTGMTGSSITTQAGGWLNASDDSPASITVTSVPVRDLVAGLTVAGAGLTDQNDVYLSNGTPAEGRLSYNGQGGGLIYPDSGRWNGGSSYHTTDYPPFPFDGTWTFSGNAPAPTVTRNDVAAEVNWENV